MKRPFPGPWVVILASIALVGCSDGGDPAGPSNDPDPVVQLDYDADVQSIWSRNCGSACHGAGGNGGLDLRAGQSHANLVGVVSPSYGVARVVAGDPDASVLFNKITNTGTYGGLMPAGGPALGADDIAVIRAWILAGAPDGAFDPPASATAISLAIPTPRSGGPR